MTLSYRNLSVPVLLTALALTACGGDDGGEGDEGGGGGEPGATHAQALEALNTGGCAIASCHGTTAKAMLQFSATTDLTADLVNQPSCEAPSVKLVEPGNPAKSWLYIKLTAPHKANGDLEPQKAWGESGACRDAAGFGKRMPQVSGYMLEQPKIDIIESWIKGGAPGPL